MIDFHSHIIPTIDDGARSIEETISLIKEAKDAGFSKIISTSHYVTGKYEFNENSRKQFLELIKQDVSNLGIDIELCLGSEIYVCYNIVELLKENKASTINGTNYVLFELPMQMELPNLKNIIYDLMKNGYKPIIAHPERYEYVKKNPNWLLEYLEIGVLFQANYGSIIGLYGKKAKKTAKLLLKNNMIHFLGSDVHKTRTIYNKMHEINKELLKILNEDKLENLTKNNARLVLENKIIYTEQPQKIERSIFGKFFSLVKFREVK